MSDCTCSVREKDIRVRDNHHDPLSLCSLGVKNLRGYPIGHSLMCPRSSPDERNDLLIRREKTDIFMEESWQIKNLWNVIFAAVGHKSRKRSWPRGFLDFRLCKGTSPKTGPNTKGNESRHVERPRERKIYLTSFDFSDGKILSEKRKKQLFEVRELNESQENEKAPWHGWDKRQNLDLTPPRAQMYL